MNNRDFFTENIFLEYFLKLFSRKYEFKDAVIYDSRGINLSDNEEFFEEIHEFLNGSFSRKTKKKRL